MDILKNVPTVSDGSQVWLDFLYHLPTDFLSVAQRLQFMLMIEASWDEFHAPTIVYDLLQHRKLWNGAMMLTDGHPLWPLPYLDEWWNVDTLYVWSSGKGPDELRTIADNWSADEIGWVEETMKPKVDKREVSKILRVWWS